MFLAGPSNIWMTRSGHVEVDHLGVLDVAHALVVADGQRQEGDEHEAAVEHVAIEEIGGYAMRRSSVARRCDRRGRRPPLVKSSVVETSTLVPVDDLAAKCARL